jgi:hypothetical protein
VVPDFFVPIPVWRVFRQIKNVKPRLLQDEGFRFVGRVWSSLIHYDDEVAARKVPQHLAEKTDDFCRTNSLFHQTK